jgi:glycosyltransferase involved in cell wall biosynthesis
MKAGPLMHKAVAVIPCYNHPQTIGLMVVAVRAHGLEVVVVDDGSDAACAEVLDKLAALHGAGMALLRLDHNQGKGGAMMAGLRAALRWATPTCCRSTPTASTSLATSRPSSPQPGRAPRP